MRKLQARKCFQIFIFTIFLLFLFLILIIKIYFLVPSHLSYHLALSEQTSYAYQ